MKKIGLIIAIERELNAFLQSGDKIEIISKGYHKVFYTHIGNNEVYAVLSGYGEIDAAATTQLLISKYNVDLIMNFGVTGALEKGLKVDDLFVVHKVINHDYDVSAIDPVKLHQYSEFKDEFIPLTSNYDDLIKSVCPDIKEGIVASGDKFIDKLDDKIALSKLGCNICDMEIAAIARISYLNKVDCISIKCISDTLEGNGGDFNKNVDKSAKKAFKILKNIIVNID